MVKACCKNAHVNLGPDPAVRPGKNPKLVVTLPVLLTTFFSLLTTYYLLLHSLPAVANTALPAGGYLQHATAFELPQLSVPMAPSALTTRPRLLLL